MKTLEEWSDAEAGTGYILVMKDEGTVYVLHRKTKADALEQLRLYERDNLFEETRLKEVGGLDLANQCDFETYPDGSFVLVGSEPPKLRRPGIGLSELPQVEDDKLLSELHQVLEEYEFESEVQPLMERLAPHIEGLIRERNGAEAAEQELEDQINSLQGELLEAQALNDQLGTELSSAEAEADDWLELFEESDGKAEEMREELARSDNLNKGYERRILQLKTRIAELETLVENGDKIMSEAQLHNSHDDLPSAKELSKSTAALNKAAKNLILSHCNVCNKTLKNPKGLAQHLRDTKCGVIDQQAVTAGCQPISLPTEAKWAYQRDAVKWNALSTSFETLVRYSALAFAVYHVTGIF